MKKMINTLPYLAIATIFFYLCPLLMMNTVSAMIILLVVFPVLCLILGLFYGNKFGFNILLALLMGVIFLPTIYIYYNETATVYILIYSTFTLLGNILGYVFYKRNLLKNNKQ